MEEGLQIIPHEVKSLAYRFGQTFLHTKWINLNDKEKSVCPFVAVF